MKYKRIATMFSAALIAGAMVAPSFAQEYGTHHGRDWENNAGMSGGSEDMTLHEFLDNNPDFAKRYRENPSIIYDRETMAHEPGFRAYLESHPDVQAHLYGNRPGYNKMGRWESRDTRDERRADRGDDFMSSHPGVAKQLRENPSLAHNPDFIKQHPNYQEYLRNHPAARY
jgi:hypothetical protein